MFNLWRSKISREIESEKLIIALKKTGKPQLSDLQKKELKSTILMNIAEPRENELPLSLRILAQKIQNLGSKVKLPNTIAVATKERILDIVERSPFWPTRKISFRFALSGILLFAFISSTVLLLPTHNIVPVTYASATYLDELSGEVFILRNGKMIPGKESFALEEGDTVITKDKSFVAVHFFDDSLSRLGENTGVELRKLYTDPLNPILTHVELFLNEGHLWNRVVNLVDEQSSFKVETVASQANVSKKAAFDVYAQKDATQVTVFDNVVDVLPLHQSENQPKTVVAGYQSQISNAGVQTIELTPPRDGSIDQPNNTWVVSNLSLDKKYDQHLSHEKEQLFNNQDTSNPPSNVEINSKNIIVFSNPAVEEQKTAFLDAYNNLIGAETMLVRNQHKEGLRLLRAFRREVSLVIDKLDELGKKDAFNTDLLRSIIKDRISLQEKDLAAFLPNDNLYAAKKVLQQVELMLPASEIAKTQLRLAQAESKLFEIQQLLKDGNYSLALAILRDYKDLTSQLVLQLDAEHFVQLKDQLIGIVTQQVEQIKVLTAVEQSRNIQYHKDFQAAVKEVREENLRKLMSSLEQLQETVPKEIVLQLKDIFDTYLASSTDYEDLITPVFDKLLNNKDHQLSFIQPSQNLPTDLGVVVIVSNEASSDLKQNVVEDTLDNILPTQATQGLNAANSQEPKN